MSPEEQRIAIAKACGVQTIAYTFYYSSHGGRDRWHIEETKSEAEFYRDLMHGDDLIEVLHPRVPDYLDDLNAMHEAEAMIPAEKWLEFDRHVSNTSPTEYQTNWINRMYRATASQRAEAFLRTLNLWKS